MKLKLYSINDRYAFSIGQFSSLKHFLICPDIQPTYKYAWEAYKDAHKIYQSQYLHIDALQKVSADDLAVEDISSTQEVSAEKMIVGHYSKLYEIMIGRTKTFKDEKDKKIAYDEVKAIVSGLLKVKENLEKDEDIEGIEEVLCKFRSLVKEKFPKLLAKDKAEMEAKKDEVPETPPMPQISDVTNPEMGGQPSSEGELPMMPMAQVDAIMKYGSNTINDIRKEILDEYAERVCKCIEKKHPDAICKIDYDNGVFRVASASEGSILRISVNEDLNIQDIEPEGDLSNSFPFHSLEFYQKYWKPIVEKIGHCLPRDLGIIICPAKSTLPDIPNNFPNSIKILGFSIKDKEEKPFEIYFGGEKPTWMLKRIELVKEAKGVKEVRPSKYTEEDFIRGQPKRVQCIDQNLKSIYGKIGEVKQIIPLQDHIELDIDFGRLVVRLTEDQIELVDEIPSNT